MSELVTCKDLTKRFGNHTALDGLNNHHAGIHAGLFVGHIDHPIAEGAQEAALTELNDTLRLRRDAAGHFDGRKGGSIELNHG